MWRIIEVCKYNIHQSSVVNIYHLFRDLWLRWVGKLNSEMTLKGVCEFGLWFKQEPVDIILKMMWFTIPRRCFGIVGAYAPRHSALQYLGGEVKNDQTVSGGNARFGLPPQPPVDSMSRDDKLDSRWHGLHFKNGSFVLLAYFCHRKNT